MNSEPRQRINYLVSTLRSYSSLLIVPAIVGLVLATLYAFLLMPEMWTARQSFLIRDDLSGTAFKPGRFDSEESRKSAQETILEVARRPLVVRSVLKKLGPESVMASGKWITDEVIEDTQKMIDISAPNGAEFGKTDAIVLTAKASARERTRKFIELLSEEIIMQTNRVRSLRFESMESESGQAYQAAVQARDEAIDRLTELDKRLGSDFGFLTLQSGQPNFNTQPSGVETIKTEILRKQGELDEAQAVFKALMKAFNNPATASQLPSKVLVAQPNLENAMTRLLNFQEQLHLAKGLYSNKHARVRSIQKSISFLRQQLYNSLTGEMGGVQADIQLKKRQIAGLQDRLEKQKARLIRLSKARSEHMALKTQVDQLGSTANLAKTTWTEIKSRAKTARTVGLLTPTDVAQVSSRPDGIGKRFIAMAGAFGGLLIGIGLIFTIAPPMTTEPISQQPPSTPQPARTGNTASPRMPQQQITTPAPNFTAAGNSVTTASFQHAASAMHSAAAAMQLAANSDPVAPPQPVTPRPAAPAQPQSRTTAEPSKRPAASQPQQRPVEAKPASAPQLPKTKAVPVAPVANVRPVDLAKSAAEKNEFVRVPNDAAVTPPSTPVSQTPQQAKADSVSSQPTASAPRASGSTIMMSDNEKAKAMIDAGVRLPSSSEPFAATPMGDPSLAPVNPPSENLNDAIPDQIRKLSESIMKFGKDKK